MKSFVFNLIAILICLHPLAQIPISPANPGNPYDYIGSTHNEGLDFIIRKYPAMSSRFFTENWKTVTADFLTSKQLDSRTFLSVITDPAIDNKCGSFSFYTDKNPEEELKYYLETGIISRLRYDKVMELYTLVNETSALLTVTGGDVTKAYSTFFDRIVHIESGYKSLPDDDQSFCYMISSLIRYSQFYWFNEGSKDESAWRVPKYSMTGTGFNWAKLGIIDAGGAVAGALRYGIAAYFQGHTNWRAAAIASLGAGLGASAGYAFTRLFGF